MRKKIALYSIALLFVLPPLFISSAAAKPFYEGKVIKIIVCTRPGGAYDFYGRLMARFMKKYLPGSTIIVKNVVGAGQIIGANMIYQAKPDGLTFGVLNRAVGMGQVAGLKGIKFNIAKMSWLGSPASEITAFIVNAKKFKNLDDVLKADNVRMVTGGVGTVAYVTTLLFFSMLGQDNFSLGTGYAGGEIELSIMRGAMDGNFGAFQSRQVMVKEGYGRVLLFIGKTKPAGYENVPFLQEVIKDKKHKPLIDILMGFNEIGKPTAGPPGIPRDRLKILRDAFTKALHDPEVLKYAKKANRPINPVGFKECEKNAKGFLELPTDIVDAIKSAFRER
jgi:tripartite-type tricarboxylate transporter receptor subunit TctC